MTFPDWHQSEWPDEGQDYERIHVVDGWEFWSFEHHARGEVVCVWHWEPRVFRNIASIDTVEHPVPESVCAYARALRALLS